MFRSYFLRLALFFCDKITLESLTGCSLVVYFTLVDSAVLQTVVFVYQYTGILMTLNLSRGTSQGDPHSYLPA
jgi:hypothetical protein